MDDAFFMSEALKEAEKAAAAAEVPIGCVIVKDGKIIARAHNRTIRDNNPVAHAEILAIQKAAKKLKNYRLTKCDIYVTIEPCAMCAGAMVWARIKKVVYGASDIKAGACGSIFNVVQNKKLNHYVRVKSGILEKNCSKIMRDFFKEKR